MKQRQITHKDFFFCYDKELSKNLQGMGFEYICSARHNKTGNRFQMFYRSDELNAVLADMTKSAGN